MKDMGGVPSDDKMIPNASNRSPICYRSLFPIVVCLAQEFAARAWPNVSAHACRPTLIALGDCLSCSRLCFRFIFWRCWVWDQYLSKNNNENCESWELWNFETLKIWSFAVLKSWWRFDFLYLQWKECLPPHKIPNPNPATDPKCTWIIHRYSWVILGYWSIHGYPANLNRYPCVIHG